MSNKTNGKLYKLDSININGTNNSLQKIKQIISVYNTKEKNNFSEKEIKSTINSNKFKFKLYTLVTDINNHPDWKLFIDTLTEDNNDELRSVNSSFLFFIYNKTDVYILSRGYHSYLAIEQFIKRDFGIDVMSCLLNEKLTHIKGLSERKFFGDEFFTQRNFKGEYVLSYDDNFGKIYNEIIAEISENDFKKIGIVKKKKNFSNATINVSNSLEITSAFDFKELIERVTKIDELLKKTKSKDKINPNHFTKLNHSKLKSIGSKLESKVLESCYESITEGENKIDFFYHNIIMFLNSSKLTILVKDGEILFETNNLKSINFLNVFDEFKDNLLIDNLENFSNSIRELILKLEFNNEEDNFIETSIFDWINAEVEYEGKNYFKIDGDWYSFENNLDTYLKDQINNIDFSNLNIKKLETWEETTPQNRKKGYHEGCFNSKHRDKESFIVADKCFYKRIELADIIKIEDNNIFLYHVKRGIDRDLRVLSSQVINAARIIRYDLSDKLLDEYYETIRKTQYQSNDVIIIKNTKEVKITKPDFIKLFKENKFQINFVFAISSDKKDELKDQLIKSQSRIAKLAFIHTFKEMKKYEYNLNFELIEEI